jgi:hypothetical protein
LLAFRYKTRYNIPRIAFNNPAMNHAETRCSGERGAGVHFPHHATLPNLHDIASTITTERCDEVISIKITQ